MQSFYLCAADRKYLTCIFKGNFQIAEKNNVCNVFTFCLGWGVLVCVLVT